MPFTLIYGHPIHKFLAKKRIKSFKSVINRQATYHLFGGRCLKYLRDNTNDLRALTKFCNGAKDI